MKYITEKSFGSLADCREKSSLMWDTHERTLISHTPIFDINSVFRTSKDGHKGNFVEIAAPTWVNIIPFFIDSHGVPRFVMERQYRHGSNSVTVEFPAGIVEKDEDPADAALREMEEETGIRCHKLTKLGELNTNPAFMNNLGYFFLAEELEELGTRHFDENEDIDVITIPCEEALSKMGEGDFDNGVMLIAAFYFLKECNHLLNLTRDK